MEGGFLFTTSGLPDDWVQKVQGQHLKPLARQALSQQLTGDLIFSLKSWAPQLLQGVQDDEARAGLHMTLVSYVSALRSHRQVLMPEIIEQHGFKFRHASSSMIHQVLASLDLRSRGMLRKVAKKCIQACLPAALADVCLPWVEKLTVSPSSLQRGRFTLDLALLRMHQAFLSAMGGVLRFGWGDGTYKGRREWYNTRYRYLPREHVIQAARASKWLSKNPPRRFEDRDDSNHGFQPDEDEDFDELHNLRCKHSQFLFDHILLHTHLPQRLGQGHTTLVDKVSAHIHSTLLEVTSVDELVDALDSYVVWCADMGTEVGLPDFTAEHLLQALPPYLRPGVMHSDVDDGDEAHIHGYGEPRCNHARPLMQGTIVVPGVCHAIHNATKDMQSALVCWPDFLKDLKTLHALIGHPSRRERFVEKVLDGTNMYDQGKRELHGFSASLYEERWGEIGSYLQHARAAREIVFQHWDERKFCGREVARASEEDGWSPASITALVNSNFFRMYWDMQLSGRAVIIKCLRWAEGCSCHERAILGVSSHQAERNLRLEISAPIEVPCRCPLMGARAAELVDGKLSDVLTDLSAKTQAEFITECLWRLTSEEWDKLGSEWQRLVVFIQSDLDLRLAHWRTLPWLLFGACHHHEGKARQWLRAALDKWKALSPEAQAVQHVKVVELFGPDLLGPVESYLADEKTSIEDFPELEHFLAPLRLAQVAERIMEGAHKEMDAGENSSAGSALVSLNMRAPELSKLLALRPALFFDLMAAYESVRRIRNFGRIFPGHAHHPLLLALRRRDQTSAWHKVVAQIVYRDVKLQFSNLQDAARHNQLHSDRAARRKAKLEGRGAVVAPSEDLLLVSEFVNHLRVLHAEEPNHAFSFPRISNGTQLFQDASALLKANAVGQELVVGGEAGQGVDVEGGQGGDGQEEIDKVFFTILLPRPSAIHRPLHAACTMPSLDRRDIVVQTFKNLGSPDAPVVPAVMAPTSVVASSGTLLQGLVGADVQELQRRAYIWKREGLIKYVLPGTDGIMGSEGVSACISRMLEAGALPKAAGSYAPLEDELHLLEHMCKQGFAEQSDGATWKLTGAGIVALEYQRRLGSPSPLFQPRALPIANLTTFELVLKLQVDGWTWQRLPAKLADRSALKYCVGDADGHGMSPKVWYTAGVTVQRAYLLCLLQAPDLRDHHAITWLPHHASDRAFSRILEGVQPEVAMQQNPARKRKLPALLAMDVEHGDVDVGFGPDPLPFADRVCDGDARADDDNFDEVGSGEEIEFEEDIADGVPMQGGGEAVGGNSTPGHDGGDADDGAMTPVHDGGHGGGSPSGIATPPAGGGGLSPGRHVDEDQLPPPPLPPPLDNSDVDPEIDPLDADEMARIAAWGSFTFSRKSRARAPPNGAIQASCRFHARNSVTGCKRLIRILTPDAEGERRAQLTLQHWCNNALHFNRQRWHVRMSLAWEDIPSPALVEAQRLDDEPPAVPPRDDELDAAEVAAAPAPAGAGAKAKAGGKAKPKAGPGGKAKAKGKAKGKAAGAKAKGKAKALPVAAAAGGAESGGPGPSSDEVGPNTSSEEDGSSSSSDSDSDSDSSDDS